MSTPVSQYNKTPTALPPIPPASPNKPANNLGLLVSNKSRRPSAERPQLPLKREESPDNVDLEAAVTLERQTLFSENSPPPIPGDLPASRPKVERRLTSPSKKPDLLTPLRSASKAQKTITPFSPAYSLSPRESATANYAQEFDNLAAELIEVLDAERKTSEGPTEKESESDSPKKRPEKSSSHPTSGQAVSGARSPEKTSRLKNLQRLSLATTLPTRHRLPRAKALPGNTTVQKDPDNAGSGPKN